ncbi:putative lipid II flippase FtsW [Bacillus horti]|uniref:Probable peptidoglycan glycosyltransferase FtsW n=1 Tax=Caldalkalibacillus horti TaxID=77523 RepID=A0ABT9W3L7_9BACI|nr:putative lipid II flippase FtsW [Bacillus horti]MDQ0167845.1 cell division protein FtsW [Bacillus horti]
MEEQQLRKGQPDFIILILTFILTGIGLVMVYSSSQIHAYTGWGDSTYFIKQQVRNGMLGLVVMFVVMNIPYRIYRKFIPLILLGLLVLMTLVFIPGLGVEAKGAQRWLYIGPINLQPSELVKIGLVIYLASIYSKKQEYISDFKRGVVPPLVVVAIFFTLILMQRDLGTGMSVIFFTLVMIFCSGAQFKHILGLGILSGIIGSIFIFTQSYRLERFTSFLDPWSDPLGSGFQLTQSLIAIGNGGFLGKGFGNSIQKYMYLPEAHTDFIFAIIAEELGLLGISFILLCYVLLLLRGIRAAVRCPDSFGTLLGIGIVAMIGVQVLINIAVVSGRLPVTGITLPFLSYGGTSLILTLSSIGILLNVSRYAVEEEVPNQRSVN